MAEAKASVAPETDKTAAQQLKPFQFKPGQSGNAKGRPKGSRNKLAEDFLSDMLEVWKDKGRDAIERTAKEHPEKFVATVASLLPKQAEIDVTDAAVDLAKGLHAVAEFLESFATDESSAHHAGHVPDGSVLPAGVRPQAH